MSPTLKAETVICVCFYVEWASKFSITRGSPSGFGIKAATPLLPHHRYVATWQCSARLGHGAALSALRRSAHQSSLRPPSLSPSTSISTSRPARTESIHSRLSDSDRGCSPLLTALFSRDVDLADCSVQKLRLHARLFLVPGAERRVGPVA